MVGDLSKQKTSRSLFLRPRKIHSVLERATQDMYRRNFELAQTNKTLSLLRAIDIMVLESQDSLQVLCQRISHAIAKANDYPFVAILTHNHSYKTELQLAGWDSQGVDNEQTDEILSNIHIDTYLPWITNHEHNINININLLKDEETASMLQLTKAEIKKLTKLLPLSSIYIAKLTARQRLVGLMIVGFQGRTGAIPESEQLLLTRLSEAVGVALDNRLLYEENLRVLKKLQRTNEKLKLMDETKDEFISMASHQLRTPLTSVKGYISMVMEGDSGPITDQQKKLLDQAFISAQRMVYLIADLLNVSRLKTGKFVLESTPSNLADLVEGEISQLKETAASRKLKLTYEKPPHLTRLMLDETKIRQVIMNFVDNAIYYTPAGGSIEVTVSETAEAVEFKVTDSGIGVPKSEQHELFSKFYRAGNAKKARPDGTGLGLFMAKKVIIAQGGSLIFSSQEGKGSTFGFTFPKVKLAVPDHLENK